MPDSFPPAPGGSAGSFPQGHEQREDAPTQDGGALLFRRYRVIRELGRGGMGVVLLAHDTALEIPVAVKLVPDMVVKDTEAIADLRKEVLRGMALAHPGIVRTHNFEKDESGAGIVMEYVEGDNLTELKVRQPGGCFDPEQIVPWLEQLCAVLDHAHRDAHIVHRDLKPRNIMLTMSGRLKVADFGIAAVLSDSMSRHSMEGKVSGTLSYMSPQQAQGMRPDTLDDIHALGATIYELLTGKPPFFRGNPATILAQIVSVVPPNMAERREDLDVAGKAPLPPQWEETIAACLAKDPSQRPQSAGEVLARLRVAAAPPPQEIAATPRRRSDNAAAGAPITPASASKGAPFVNNLGMKLVPAGTPGMLFCVWETRVKDFAEFIRESGYDMSKGEKAYTLESGGWKRAGGNWRNPRFPEPQGEDHPVVCVSWADAEAFCEWLTSVERAAGMLTPRQSYRLPTDHEWSLAVGIGIRENAQASPRDKDQRISDAYPWGRRWPPPDGAGNFAGEESRVGVAKTIKWEVIAGYDDGYPRTAPAGSFAPNAFGLHDLAGNVWEWCEDWYDSEKKYRVMRGGSWVFNNPWSLLSSYRGRDRSGMRSANYGFRCVLARSDP